MLRQDLLRVLHKIENESPNLYLRHTYKGQPIWPIVRNQLAFTLDDEILSSSYGTRNKFPIRINFLKMKQVFFFMRKNTENKLNRYSKVLVLTNGANFVPGQNNSYRDRIFGDILNETERMGIQSSIFFLGSVSHRKDLSSLGNSMGSVRDITTTSLVISLRSRLVLKLNQSLISNVQQILRCIPASIEYPHGFKKTIAKEVIKTHFWFTYFSKRIPREAKFAFVSNYFNSVGFGYTRACLSKGIKVIDVQHGVSGNLNPAYSDWLGYAEFFKFLPDNLFVWDRITKRELESHSYYKPSLFVVPKNYPLSLPGDFILDNREKYRITVLVTYDTDFNFSWHSAVDQLLLSEKLSDVYFLVRLHPGRINNIERLTDKFGSLTNVNVEMSSLAELPDLFSVSDCVLSKGSALVIEALNFGLEVIISEESKDFLSYDQSMIHYVAEKASTIGAEVEQIQQKDSLICKRNGLADLKVAFDELGLTQF